MEPIPPFSTRSLSRRSFLRVPMAGAAALLATEAAHAPPPNIVYILADDLGFGDAHFLNPEHGKLATPNIDRLATQGVAFTDAHGGSAVCSPTRYGILTGRYCWRSRLQQGVLLPYDSPLIPKDRLTVPAMLRAHGYATACIGKWHLGWNWPRENGQVVFGRPITGGPTDVGFDYYFGTDVPNYPPYCFIENNRTLGIPAIPKPRSMYGEDGIMLPGWRLDAILPTLAEKAAEFIGHHARRKSPFFLYLPLTSPRKEWLRPLWRLGDANGLGLGSSAESDRAQRNCREYLGYLHQ